MEMVCQGWKWWVRDRMVQDNSYTIVLLEDQEGEGFVKHSHIPVNDGNE